MISNVILIITIIANFRIFPLPKEELWTANSHLLSLSPFLVPWQPLIYSPFLWICMFSSFILAAQINILFLFIIQYSVLWMNISDKTIHSSVGGISRTCVYSLLDEWLNCFHNDCSLPTIIEWQSHFLHIYILSSFVFSKLCVRVYVCICVCVAILEYMNLAFWFWQYCHNKCYFLECFHVYWPFIYL